VTRRSARGFTLIEILIALTILSVIATLGYRALASLTESEVRLTAEAARWRALDGLFARLEADLRQALPREARVGAAREPAWIADADFAGNTELRVSRAGPEFEADPGAAGQRIGYRLRDATFEILYWPHFDRPATTLPQIYALATGVVAFRATFLDSTGTWRSRWPELGATDMPRAARIELALDDGTRVERVLALR
jgi:general secretion pathway protein J